MALKFLAFLSFAGAVVLEAMALRALLEPPQGGGPMMLHLWTWHGLGLLCGLGPMLGWWPLTRRLDRLAFLALYLGLCLPLPGVGLLLMAGIRGAMCFAPRLRSRSNYILEERADWQRPFIKEPRRAAPQSVLEILSGTNEELRRTAIMALRFVDARKSLPLLQKAIQDSDEQVRLLAQTQFNRVLSSLEGAVKKMESELAEGSVSAHLRVLLAENYHELVYLGMSSPETERLYLDRAIHLLDEVLVQDPRHSAALFLRLKCCVKGRQVSAAKQAALKLRQAGCPAASLAPWEAEISFIERDWPGVSQALQSLASSADPDPRLRGLLEFWLGPKLKGKGAA